MDNDSCATKPAGDVLDEALACDYLHQTPRTLRDWRKRRGLPHCKVTAKVILYRKGDLDAWLAKSRTAHMGRRGAL